MTADPVALSPRLERKRIAHREYVREYRAKQRAARPPTEKRAPSPRHGDDIGPAIAEGSWCVDDLSWCEQEWMRLMAGQRFENRAPR
jgi:hypothetical protein